MPDTGSIMLSVPPRTGAARDAAYERQDTRVLGFRGLGFRDKQAKLGF